MIRVVLDTNVVISAHLTKHGISAMVFRLALARKFVWCVCDPLLEEYEDVLRRDKFSLPSALVTQSMKHIRKVGKKIKSYKTVTASPDEDDNRFLECAEQAKADYLVMGNIKHFPKQWKATRIVTPREFLEIVITSK
jgi:putative PIN family toxin of toxin-antitoxin system